MSGMTALLPRAPLLVLAASLAILGAALASQYLGGLAPCELCLWQRWAYVATIGLGLAALLAGGRLRAGLIGLAALAFLAGAGIAGFHVGVEQHWWAGLPGCSAGTGAQTLEALRAQVLAAPVVRCDEVAFSFLGLSMAGWNVVASLVLAVFSAAAARLLWRSAA
jgi:disulfide bond formation protein DsbB